MGGHQLLVSTGGRLDELLLLLRDVASENDTFDRGPVYDPAGVGMLCGVVEGVFEGLNVLMCGSGADGANG